MHNVISRDNNGNIDPTAIIAVIYNDMMPEAGHIDYGCLIMQHNVAADSYVLLLCIAVPASQYMRCRCMYKKSLSLRVSDMLIRLRKTGSAKGEIKKGLTQKDLAWNLGMSNKTISDYEVGKTDIKLLVLVKIVKLFGYDVFLGLIPETSIAGNIEKYKQCVEINMILMDQPVDTVRRVLHDLGVDINI